MTDTLPVPVDASPALQHSGLGLLDALDAALLELNDRLPELVGRPEVQATIHIRLDLLRRNIATALDELERLLLDEMPLRENRKGRMVRERITLDGVGVVEPADKGGRWAEVNYPRLIGDVIREQWDAGNIEHPSEVGELLAEVLTFSGIRSDKAKNTGLVKYGHDRGEYATYVPGSPGVRIIPAEGAQT